jgi:hypothetical protein
MESTKKRAAKLESKGKPVDFKELLRMERTPGRPSNTASKHWQRWPERESLCVVPFTSFGERGAAERPSVWLARDESRPLMFFAGVWTTWTSVRNVRTGAAKNQRYSESGLYSVILRSNKPEAKHVRGSAVDPQDGRLSRAHTGLSPLQ